MEKEQHCLLLNTRLQNIFTTNTFKPFNIKEIMKKILFLLLFVLTANNYVFAQSENNDLIIDLNRIFPYGLPKNIKGYATDHKGKDSLFLDMKFKFLHEDEEINYNLVQQIINGRDTVHFAYGIETPIMNYGLFKDGYIGFKENDIGQIAIINYSIKRFMEEFEEDGGEYGTDTRLVLNKEGFAKWALDLDTHRGSGGYVFYYDGDHIESITSPHGDHHRGADNLFFVRYPKLELGPNGSVLLFEDGWYLDTAGGPLNTSCSYYCDPKNPIMNHSGIMVNMLLDDFYGYTQMPHDLYSAMRRDLYYAGLLGLPCGYLPNRSYSSVTYYLNDDSPSNYILINGTYTWVLSNFTKETERRGTETVELPTKVTIDYTFDIEEEGITRKRKKEILDNWKAENMHPQKVIFTFEW